MGIQSSINTALGVAALASGLTNKKQVEKAQDKLENTKDKLANTEAENKNLSAENKDLSAENKDLSAENKEKSEILSATKDEENMKLGKNTYDVSNVLPTAKATNVDANDKIDVISSKSINPSIASSLTEFLKSQQKINPYTVEQDMGLRALKMKDSMVAAKRELRERSRRVMTDPRTMRALEVEKGGTYSMKLDPRTMRELGVKEDGTYSFRNGRLVKENLKSGYQVSFFRPEITDENIQSTLKKIGSKLGPAYLGLFEGSPEISYCIKDKDKAMEFAQAFNQYSIWDNKKGEQILNDKYNESATVDYNVALGNFTKALNNKNGGNE